MRDLRAFDLVLCPVCGAVSPVGTAFDHHLGWHLATDTMLGWLYQDAVARAKNIGDYLTPKS